MSNKTYCSIDKYVRIVEPKLSELMDSLCIGKLHSSRLVTFILPNSNLIKTILKESDPNLQDTYIKSLIITDYIPDISSFESKSEIPNLLNKKIEISKVTTTKVTLKCGIVIAIDSKYKPMNKNERTAVYKVTDDTNEFPIDGPDAEYFAKRTRKTKKLFKKGEGEINKDLINEKLREKLFNITINEYIVNKVNKKLISDGNPFVKYLLSLLNFMEDNQTNVTNDTDESYKILLNKALSLLVPSAEASFYVIIEPYRTVSKEFIIPIEVIDKWWNSESNRLFIDIKNGDIVSYCTKYREYLDKASKLVNEDVIKIVKSINKSFKGTSLVTSLDHIINIYNKFDTNKTIEQLKVFNQYDYLNHLYTKETHYKLWLDEIRYFITQGFNKIHNDFICNGKDVDALFIILKGTFPGNKYSNEIRLTKDHFRDKLLPINDFIINVIGFIASGFYFYVPTPVKDLCNQSINKVKFGGNKEYKKQINNISNLHKEVLDDLDLYNTTGGIPAGIASKFKKLAEKGKQIGQKAIDRGRKYYDNPDLISEDVSNVGKIVSQTVKDTKSMFGQNELEIDMEMNDE